MALTYEENPRDIPLETYEWDDIWFDHIPETDKPRILLVGDSISRGYRFPVIEALNDSYHTDGWASSKAVDNPAYIPQLDLMISQAKDYKLIHINNGLHGWHLSTEDYKNNYEKIICHIQKKYPEIKLVLCLTTPVRNSKTKELSDRNSLVISRNEAVLELASKYDLPVTDLYNSTLLESFATYTDTVHQNEDGYKLLAEIVNSKIREVLK